jgi:hypothetical protein
MFFVSGTFDFAPEGSGGREDSLKLQGRDYIGPAAKAQFLMPACIVAVKARSKDNRASIKLYFPALVFKIYGLRRAEFFTGLASAPLKVEAVLAVNNPGIGHCLGN